MNLIISGMMYGDEGKGSIIDYIVNKYQPCSMNLIRSTGGCQGMHHISINNQLFKFSQLSSGSITLNDDKQICSTYFTKEFVINLKTLVVEVNEIADKLKILPSNIIKSLHINENCRVVTEYHKLLGIVKETIKENRRGSMSSGVSTTASLSDNPSLTVYLKDIIHSHVNDTFKNKLISLRLYLTKFIEDNRDKINIAENSIDDSRYDHIINTLNIYTSDEFFDHEYNKIIESYKYLLLAGLDTYKNDKEILSIPIKNRLFESSQGLLLDKNYGTVPNTTLLNINNDYAFELCKGQETKVIGVARALVTRHGPGLFPTYDEYLNTVLSDDNQDVRKFAGKPKYGWFDTVLMRYSSKILKVDEIILTCVDELFKLDNVKICTKYKVNSDIPEQEIDKYFLYETIDNCFYIYDVKTIDKEIFNILSKSVPVYEDFGKGSNIILYIRRIEELMAKKIVTISVGPDRKDKLDLR